MAHRTHAQQIERRHIRHGTEHFFKTKGGAIFDVGGGIQVLDHSLYSTENQLAGGATKIPYILARAPEDAALSIPLELEPMMRSFLDRMRGVRNFDFESRLCPERNYMRYILFWGSDLESMCEHFIRLMVRGTVMVNPHGDVYWHHLFEHEESDGFLRSILARGRYSQIALVDRSNQCVRIWQPNRETIDLGDQIRLRRDIEEVAEQWLNRLYRSQMTSHSEPYRDLILQNTDLIKDAGDRETAQARQAPLRFLSGWIAKGEPWALLLAKHFTVAPLVGNCMICQEIEPLPVPLACSHFLGLYCTMRRLYTDRGPFTCYECGIPLPFIALKAALTRSNAMAARIVLQKYIDTTVMAYIAERPHQLATCPSWNCTYYYERAVGVTTYTEHACLKCGAVFCRACGAAHLPNIVACNTGDVFSDESGVRVLNCQGRGGTCRAPLSKTEGCDHMICPRCGFHSCWLCGATWENGPDAGALVYTHMDQMHNVQVMMPVPNANANGNQDEDMDEGQIEGNENQ